MLRRVNLYCSTPADRSCIFRGRENGRPSSDLAPIFGRGLGYSCTVISVVFVAVESLSLEDAQSAQFATFFSPGHGLIKQPCRQPIILIAARLQA
jgi:hypothetical protein